MSGPAHLWKLPPNRRMIYRWLLPVAIVVWLLPLISLLLAIIRPLTDFARGNGLGIPSRFALFENISAVFATTGMARALGVGFIVALPVTLLALGMACMMGYALALSSVRVRVSVMTLFACVCLLPPDVLLVQWQNTGMLGLILIQSIRLAVPGVMLMTLLFARVPQVRLDMARAEGASEWQVFLQVACRSLRYSIGVLACALFIAVWNDLLVATIVLQERWTATTVLLPLHATRVAEWSLVATAAWIAALPALMAAVVLFFNVRRSLEEVAS